MNSIHNLQGSIADDKIANGFFEITYQNDGIYLTVYPPMGKGKGVGLSEVLEKVVRKKIRNFSRDVIETAVAKADGIPVKIAEAQQEEKIDASMTVMISPDKMRAFISLSAPEGGRMLTLDEIVSSLGRQGVVFGINRTTLETMVKYPVFNEMICVAEGVYPQNGQNGKVEFKFDINHEYKPSILEDGRVDYRELNIVQNVNAGQVLCSLIPPVPGKPGKTVTGADIPALDGKPAVMPKGRNVCASEDGQSLIAQIDGQVQYIDGKINVFSNYEVAADVDNSTGNITFVGNVIVRGNILSGFSVDAGGYIEVWGVVEGAVLRAGGDIILRRGMQGQGKGVLVSGGDIIARYIEHSNISAKNDIKSEAIMHSTVKCGNKLELSGKKGLLVGGSCKVGREISAKVIGSPMATVTDLDVGVDPSLKERYKQQKEEIAQMDSDIKKADQAITILKKLESAGRLTPDKQEMMARSVRTKLYFSNRIVEMKEELLQIEAKLQQEAQGKIKVYSYIYPGTKVAIGSCMMHVKENLQYCTLYRDGADIRVGALDR